MKEESGERFNLNGVKFPGLRLYSKLAPSTPRLDPPTRVFQSYTRRIWKDRGGSDQR